MYLAGPIRRILNKLRLLRNLYGDDFRHETGLLDLQEAIQVVASKSPRTDVFTLEELQSMVEAWAILVDASRSLNYFHGEVRGIILCLAEVANELLLDKTAWGVFAFSNKFYIVKDFSEVYTNRIRARIGGLKHSGLTYLPDGIMLAAEALKKRLEESKVLVVVSDFFPSGYENIEEELTERVKKIERSGIGVIGIGVNNEAVKNYFRTNCVVENPYELMKKFAKAFIEYSTTM
jgi:nitric oxide reductase activation protein